LQVKSALAGPFGQRRKKIEAKEFLPYFAIFLSTTALMISFQSFRRKSGISIRGSFLLSNSHEASQVYVSQVVLENLKDRSSVIYEILLQIGHNFYMSVKDFKNEPLVIRPYEVWTTEFGPVEFYGSNLVRYDINTIIQRTDVRKRLVLATSEGKIVVKRRTRYWRPLSEVLRNFYTNILIPVQLNDGDVFFGDRVKYSLEFIFLDGRREVYGILPEDYDTSRFSAFQLTKDSLKTKASFQEFMNSLVLSGQLRVKSVRVADLDEVRSEKRLFWSKSIVEAKPVGYFKGRFLGEIKSYFAIKKTRRIARKSVKLVKNDI
jgi:hypothetical protein